LPIEKVIAGERSSETQRQHADYQQQRSQYEIDLTFHRHVPQCERAKSKEYECGLISCLVLPSFIFVGADFDRQSRSAEHCLEEALK
jgi:hypothetical protein